MAAETTTAAATLVQRMWLEPLVSSSPRAASSSWRESCCKRPMATLFYSQLDRAEHRFRSALWRKGPSSLPGAIAWPEPLAAQCFPTPIILGPRPERSQKLVGIERVQHVFRSKPGAAELAEAVLHFSQVAGVVGVGIDDDLGA